MIKFIQKHVNNKIKENISHENYYHSIKIIYKLIKIEKINNK